MSQLKVKVLGVNNTPEKLLYIAKKRFRKIIDDAKYSFTDCDPDILFFLSGGTEGIALKHLVPGHFYVLIGSQYDNAYASATEVKAYLNEAGIHSILLDEEEVETKIILDDFQKIKSAVKCLKGQKLGLIGQISEWLIASKIPSALLKQKLGIKLYEIPWSELSHFSEFKKSGSLQSTFSNASEFDLSKTSQVSELLLHTIKSQKLDAITVECFPMVMKDCVTACLPLAKFNDEGVPAGCEGDLTSIVGMMICKELTGTIPWIANINKVTDDVCMFSHCTIAPGLVSDYTIKSHFETGLGTAIEGSFKNDLITIFRFDRLLCKAFIATASISGRPKSASACRTQIEVKLNEDEVKLLKHYPLGNHHLIVPGDHKQLLQFFCKYLDIEVL